MSNQLLLSRKQFTRKRRALSAQNRQRLARAASLQLTKLNSLLPSNAKVGIYYDDFGELPTQLIVDWCLKRQYKVYLPVVGSLGRHDKRLRFSPVHHSKMACMPTYKHTLGMKQHNHRTVLWADQLDVIFCPLVAIDYAGNRMGMGGGYYDRTLAKSHNYGLKNTLSTPIKIGWCYDFQLVDNLDNKAWDVPMDMAITPTRLIRF